MDKELSQAWQDEIGAFQDRTFPKATPESIIAHLKREIKELAESQCPSEAADCLLLLIGLAHKKRFNLIEEAKKKFSINLERKWGEPDAEGVCSHIE